MMPSPDIDYLTLVDSDQGDCWSSSGSSDYEIIEDLGGGCCTNEVKLANSGDGTPVVLKRIAKKNTQPQLVESELEAGKRTAEHDGVSTLREYFEDTANLYLVFEYVEGFDLWSYMDQRDFKPLPVAEVKSIFCQIVETLQYIHQQHIAHRDIKLDNILFNPKDMSTTVIDFGLCEIMENEDQKSTEFIGSPDYVCPEILTRTPYSPFAADVWSLGVVLYILLCGELPFGRNERIIGLAKGGHPPVVWPENLPIPEDAKDLVEKMLKEDPGERITLDSVAQHQFLIQDSEK